MFDTACRPIYVRLHTSASQPQRVARCRFDSTSWLRPSRSGSVFSDRYRDRSCHAVSVRRYHLNVQLGSIASIRATAAAPCFREAKERLACGVVLASFRRAPGVSSPASRGRRRGRGGAGRPGGALPPCWLLSPDTAPRPDESSSAGDYGASPAGAVPATGHSSTGTLQPACPTAAIPRTHAGGAPRFARESGQPDHVSAATRARRYSSAADHAAFLAGAVPTTGRSSTGT